MPRPVALIVQGKGTQPALRYLGILDRPVERTDGGMEIVFASGGIRSAIAVLKQAIVLGVFGAIGLA